MDEMSFTCKRRLIIKEITTGGVRISVCTFENRKSIAVTVDDAGNTRGEVWSIRLEGSSLQRVFKGIAFGNKIINRIGLITVGDDGFSVNDPYGRINNQRRVSQL